MRAFTAKKREEVNVRGTTESRGTERGGSHADITVYSKPDCVQCTATYSSLDGQGLDYEIVDLTADDAALEWVKNLGYMQAPVVVTDDDHWSGFRPDKVAALASHLMELVHADRAERR